MKYLNMCPGPTQIKNEILKNKLDFSINEDWDYRMKDLYMECSANISKLLNAQQTYILNGEGMLAIDSSIHSFILPTSKVLVLTNGVYGSYFTAMIKEKTDHVTTLEFNNKKEIDISIVKEHLKSKYDYDFAIWVHCDTPTAILNDTVTLGKLFKQYNITTMVDAISSMFVHKFDMQTDGIDIVFGTSQKTISSYNGICFVSLSKKAMDKLVLNKGKISGFYTNLTIFLDYEKQELLPYTMPYELTYYLNEGVKAIIDESTFTERHEILANALRNTLLKNNIALFEENGFSNTVTALYLENMAKEISKYILEKHNILLALGIGEHRNNIVRIGHMNANAYYEYISKTLLALEDTLQHFAILTNANLVNNFEDEVNFLLDNSILSMKDLDV